MGEVATTPEEAEGVARRLGGPVVIKAQVHAGGRGKAGGVKLARPPGEAKEKAAAILGMQIKGLTVHTVLVAPAEDIASEAYVGIILDRASKAAVWMVSAAGGIDIEEVAATTPEKITKLPVDPRYGFLPHQAYLLATKLYDNAKQQRQAAQILLQLYRAFVENGASLAEINPLITTPAGDVKAIDAKFNIDDNELFRKPAVEALRDESSEAPAEGLAREAGLTFLKLGGDVGGVVDGGGPAMAPMALAKDYGGGPAHLPGIGGSADPEKVVNALKIITSDPNVRVIL